MTNAAKGKSTGPARAGTFGKYGVPLLGYSLLFGVVIAIVLAFQKQPNFAESSLLANPHRVGLPAPLAFQPERTP